jgi:thiamine-phosphate pyrophosphorylase
MAQNCDLSVYFVADPHSCGGRSLDSVVLSALKGGITLLQLRNKEDGFEPVFAQAVRLKALADDFGVPFLVNDYPEIAMQCGAAGVHLGHEDDTPKEAREFLGSEAIIGMSSYAEQHFKDLNPKIVNYAGTGPFFASKTDKGKVVLGAERFSALIKNSPVPVVAIGGITPERASEAIRAGAQGVAMMRAISEAVDPEEAARAFVTAVAKARQDVEARRAS